MITDYLCCKIGCSRITSDSVYGSSAFACTSLVISKIITIISGACSLQNHLIWAQDKQLNSRPLLSGWLLMNHLIFARVATSRLLTRQANFSVVGRTRPVCLHSEMSSGVVLSCSIEPESIKFLHCFENPNSSMKVNQ